MIISDRLVRKAFPLRHRLDFEYVKIVIDNEEEVDDDGAHCLTWLVVVVWCRDKGHIEIAEGEEQFDNVIHIDVVLGACDSVDPVKEALISILVLLHLTVGIHLCFIIAVIIWLRVVLRIVGCPLVIFQRVGLLEEVRPTHHLVNQVKVLVPAKIFRVWELLGTFSTNADEAEGGSGHLAPELPCFDPAVFWDTCVKIGWVLNQILGKREPSTEAIVVVSGALKGIVGTDGHAYEEFDHGPLVDTPKDIVVNVRSVVTPISISIAISLLKVELLLVIHLLSDEAFIG